MVRNEYVRDRNSGSNGAKRDWNDRPSVVHRNRDVGRLIAFEFGNGEPIPKLLAQCPAEAGTGAFHERPALGTLIISD